MMVKFAIILLSLGLTSTWSLYNVAETDTVVDDQEISLLENKLYFRSLVAQTYLDSLNKDVHVYSDDQFDVGAYVQETNMQFYGLIKKIKKKIKKIIKDIKKVVEIPVDIVKGIANEAKNLVNDVTHLKQTIVNQINDLKNQIKAAVTAVTKLPGMVIGQLKNALNDAKNMARDVLTLHINKVKQDIEDIGKKLLNELKAEVKAELENAKRILEGDLKAALEAWALAELGPFGAAIGQLLEIKQQIENYKNELLNKLNLAKQLRDQVTQALKNEIDLAMKTVRDQYNNLIGQLRAQADQALQQALAAANQALGGVPAQVAAQVEHYIDMVGQGLTEARQRIADLQQQLQMAEADIKNKVQADINEFVRQHGDVIRQTQQQLQTLKAQIEAKLQAAQGEMATVLGEMRDRIDARINELTTFAHQIGAAI